MMFLLFVVDINAEMGNYRHLMRELVIAISKETKKHNPHFLVIGQNALELITVDGKPDGKAATEYVNALDAVGIEELFYGYTTQGVKTPKNITQYFLSYLGIFSKYNKPVLVIDYVDNNNQARDSFEKSLSRGFLSFQTNRQCTLIPERMFVKNEAPVKELSHAKNFLYLLNPGKFKSKKEFIDAVAATWYDVIVIDAFFWGQLLTNEEVALLQMKPNKARRLVIAYMSIGEAEDYRYYWQKGWKKEAPAFLEKENPHWEGNYKVRYWLMDWHAIIYGAQQPEAFGDSYAGKIVNAGFDGVYMDILDAAVYFEEMM